MPFFTYILQSQKSGKFYFGQTDSLQRRIQEHNSGLTASTANNRPWNIIFAKGFDTRAEAMALERKFKAWKNKQRILDWIARQAPDSP